MATLRDYRVHRRAIARSRLVIWTVILLAFGWATWGTGFGVLTFVQGIGGSFAFIATDLLPPRLEAAPQFIDDAIDTLLMSYVGMVMSVVLSLPLGVLGARNTTVHRLLSYASKGTVSFIRAAPDLIFAIFLVALFGIGPLAGTVAMGISGIGILGKAYADGIEAIDMQQVEGIRAAGGPGSRCSVRACGHSSSRRSSRGRCTGSTSTSGKPPSSGSSVRAGSAMP